MGIYKEFWEDFRKNNRKWEFLKSIYSVSEEQTPQYIVFFGL